MIPLHRMTHPDDPLWVNPDLIQTVEATPDTVVTMTNASKLLVAESAEQVTDLVCTWRARIVARALGAPEPPHDAEADVVTLPADRA